MRTLEHSIALFLSTLVPINQLDALLPGERHSVVLAYTLAHSATIYLHRGFALEDSMSFDQSSRASRACIAVIKYISERDFAFLEPIIGVWFIVSVRYPRSSPISLALLVDCCRYRDQGP